MSFISFILLSTALLVCIVVAQSNVEISVLHKPYHELSKQKLNSKELDGLFGYSIAYQHDIKSLVVGSPKENKYGQVYLCPMNETKSHGCNTVPKSDTLKKAYTGGGSQDYPWFGATVDAGKSFFVACAPRFVEINKGSGSLMSGTYSRCFYKEHHHKFLNEVKRISEHEKETFYEKTTGKEKPPKGSYREYWFDTFGLSSYVHESNSKDAYKVFLGGPAISVGRVMLISNFQHASKLVSVERKNNRIVEYNFGYSITFGYFLEHNKEMYAISTPYGTIGYGRVYFYEFTDLDFTQVQMWAEGSEASSCVGSLFGAALTSLRREDGRSALFVGAPAYALLDSGFNDGAVFIYNKFDKQPVITKMLQGNKGMSGYFGASITCVGDFDGDQIDEVAVAAPWEDNGRGAVYIYSGKHLLDDSDKPVPVLQKLFPKEKELAAVALGEPREIYFGWSLRALDDADNNGCNELAVGAPGDNSVTVYRCIASVNVTFDIQFPDLKKQAEKVQTSSTSFHFTPCFKVRYAAKPDPKNILSTVEFTITLVHPDVKIKGHPKNSIKKNEKLGANTRYCTESLEILLPKEADYDQDIKFEVSLKLVENPLVEKEFSPYRVLLNHTTNHSSVFTPSGLYGSNLTLHVLTTFRNDKNDSYLIGSSDIETMEITLSNSGNTAHDACVRTRIQGISDVQSHPLGLCADQQGDLRCSVKELHTNGNMTVKLTLNTKLLSSSDKQIVIFSQAYTSGCSKPVGQPKNITVGLITDNNITLGIVSFPRLNMTKVMLEKGKQIEHIYAIINYGVTKWTNLSCVISLPPQVMIEAVTYGSTKGSTDCKVEEQRAFCIITELLSGLSTSVKIVMNVQPGSPLVDKIKAGKASLVTKLRLSLSESVQKIAGITTTLYLWKGKGVPTWIIVVASLVGFLILVIIIWAIHECGFLQRQNKEKLEELKKDVHRQTVRRSMMIRHSKIEVDKSESARDDKQPMLSSVTEEDLASNNGELEYQNAHHVKEFHYDEDDPARIAFQAELAKALSKGNQKGVTKAQIH